MIPALFKTIHNFTKCHSLLSKYKPQNFFFI